MLQQNFMFGIQDQIKKNKEVRTKESLLESTQEPKEDIKASLEEAYNPGFMYTIYEMTEKAKKKQDNKLKLTTESFSLSRVQKKLEKDIQYFNYLFENFVHPELKGQYSDLLESIFDTTIKLYQECDVTPRVVSPALANPELTESQVIDLYKNGLNTAIKNDYTKPLLSGNVTELHESTLKNLVRKVVVEGAELDVESIKIYLPFEEAMYKYNKSILIPDIANSRIQAFVESSSGELTDLFEDTASDILRDLEKKIKLLTALVAPKTFDDVVDSDVEGSKMAGVTIISDDNFNDDPVADVCPDSLDIDPEAEEEFQADEEAFEVHDEDENGIEDSEEDGDTEDDIPGIEGIDTELDLSNEEIAELDDEDEAVAAASGEGLVGDDSTDEIEGEEDGATEEEFAGEIDLPGDGVEPDSSEDPIIDEEDIDDEVNSDAPDASEDENDNLVEDKKDK